MRVAILDCTKTNYNEERAPHLSLGGIERCVLSLSRALYNKGLDVRVFNASPAPSTYQNITWAPLSAATDFQADIVIACNDARLFDTYTAQSGHKDFKPFLWLHNPVNLWKTIRKGRLSAIIRWRPVAVFLGKTQQQATSNFIPFSQKTIIEHGIENTILNEQISHAPRPPHAAFISQSYRGLDDVIDVWKNFIHPKLPNAKLDVYSQTAQPLHLEKFGITQKGRMTRAQLLSELSDKRLMFIPGHRDETYCLAAAESLCLGIPVITYGYGSLKERVADKKTGIIATTPAEFAEQSIAILTDDVIWLDYHTNAVKTRAGADWDTRAEDWIKLWNTPE